MALRQLAPLILSDNERAELTTLTMRRKTAQALALRARIVLTCAEGGQNTEVATKLGLDRQTVGKWRRRFMEQRVAGLHDEPRSGAPRTIDDARIEAVIVRTLESCPENATHWSSRDSQRPIGIDGPTHLAGLRAPAAPDGDVQALDRSELRGQSARCRGPLRLTAGARHRSVCG